MVNEVIQPNPQRQGGGGGGYTGPLAETKPHINCPAAMLCVPRWGFWLALMLTIGHKNKDNLEFHNICSIERIITWHRIFFSTKFGCSVSGFEPGTFQLPGMHASSIPWIQISNTVIFNEMYYKVTSSNTSSLEAYADSFRLLMLGIFDPYVLCNLLTKSWFSN